MIAAGVLNTPGAPGPVTINPGFTATTFFLLSSSATADGFVAIGALGATACFGVVARRASGALDQVVGYRNYRVGNHGPIAAGCVVGDALRLVTNNSGTPVLRAQATALAAGGLTLNFLSVAAGTKVYWVAIDGTTQLSGNLGGSFDFSFNFGREAVAALTLFCQQATTSQNGLFSWGMQGPPLQAGGCQQDWAQSQQIRRWDARAGAAGFISEVDNLNVGGVSFITGSLYEILTGAPQDDRLATGIRIQQKLAGLAALTGEVWAIADGESWFDGINGDAATVDEITGIDGTLAITMGATGDVVKNGQWATAWGLSVPSLGFDVSVGVSQNTTNGSVKAFRYPNRSWVTGWDHSTGANVNAGTLLFPAGITRAVRTDAGDATINKRFGCLTLGLLAPPIAHPQIWRYV